MEKLHSWMTAGGGSTVVDLLAGNYLITSHLDARPRPEATEPLPAQQHDLDDPRATRISNVPPDEANPGPGDKRVALKADDGLSVVLRPNVPVLSGPGRFVLATDSTVTIHFGQPRCVELWRV